MVWRILPVPSSTRAGTEYLRPDVTKEDAPKVDLVSLMFGCIFEKKENTARLSTGTIAAQAATPPPKRPPPLHHHPRTA